MFISTNEQYGEGVTVNDYEQGKRLTLVQSKTYETKDGDIKSSMCFCKPQTIKKNGVQEYGDTDLPRGAIIGQGDDYKNQAIKNTVKILAHLMGSDPKTVLTQMLAKYSKETPF